MESCDSYYGKFNKGSSGAAASHQGGSYKHGGKPVAKEYGNVGKQGKSA